MNEKQNTMWLEIYFGTNGNETARVISEGPENNMVALPGKARGWKGLAGHYARVEKFVRKGDKLTVYSAKLYRIKSVSVTRQQLNVG